MFDQQILETLDAHFNIDGPHDGEKALDAARCASALIRYLNHATLPGPRAERTLEWANTVHEITGSLSAIAHSQIQLLDQLAGALDRMADHDPTLYDDRRTDEWPAAETAHEAAGFLREAARESGQLGDQLDTARNHTTYLGND